MKCPFCGVLDNRVIDSRLSQGGEVTRRRRECEKCARRYTTYERVEQVLPLIIKRDGRRQPFDRAKVMAGLQRAVIKRPVSGESLDRLVDMVETRLADLGEREVHAAIIGERILEGLKVLDPVAFVRFASVYREFDDLDEFADVLKQVTQGESGSS
ncbi:MAG: transcriptional repressor NrdR [Myxococcales bacterium]|nr:transcriptional repressor NrdR [Myxococcales bacterium]